MTGPPEDEPQTWQQVFGVRYTSGFGTHVVECDRQRAELLARQTSRPGWQRAEVVARWEGTTAWRADP